VGRPIALRTCRGFSHDHRRLYAHSLHSHERVRNCWNAYKGPPSESSL
jgi:hypothetical protein